MMAIKSMVRLYKPNDLDYINNINTLIGKSVETKEKVLAEKVHTDTNLITKLTARL